VGAQVRVASLAGLDNAPLGVWVGGEVKIANLAKWLKSRWAGGIILFGHKGSLVNKKYAARCNQGP
jgi:hypothetical protein